MGVSRWSLMARAAGRLCMTCTAEVRAGIIVLTLLSVVNLEAAEGTSVATGFPADYDVKLDSVRLALSQGGYGECIRASLALAEDFAASASRANGEALTAALAGCEAFFQIATSYLDEGVYPTGLFRRELERLYQRVPPGALKQRVLAYYGKTLAASGDSKASSRFFDLLGVVRNWYLVGPFDNERGSGFSRVFGPESLVQGGDPARLDLNSEYEGKKTKVSWREVQALSFDGVLDLHEVLRPTEWGACYLLTWFTVQRAAEYMLSVGSDDGVRVWVDRREVISRKARRPLRYDQDQVLLRLEPGEHVILAKVLQEEGDWRFQARLSVMGDAVRRAPVLGQGEPPEQVAAALAEGSVKPVADEPLCALEDLLDGIYMTKDKSFLLLKTTGPGQSGEGRAKDFLAAKGVSVSDPVEFLGNATAEELVRQFGGDVASVSPLHIASLYLFKGALLHGRFAFDVYKEFPHRDAFRKASETARLVGRPELLPLFLCFQARSEYPVARMEPEKDYNPYLKVLQEILELDASNAFALEMLIRHYGDVREFTAVEGFLRRMPETAEAGPLLRSYYEAWRDWDWLVLGQLQPYAESRYLPGAVTLARKLRADYHLREAADLLRRSLDFAHTESALFDECFDAMMTLGDYRRADEIVRIAVRLDPLRSDAFLSRLRLLERDGDYRTASLLVADRLAVVPQEPRLHELRARYLNLNGKKDEALDFFRKALEIEPNLPSVKRYLEVVSTSEDYSTPYLVDVPSLAAKYRDYSNPEEHPALVIADQMVCRIAKDGLSSYTIHRALKLLTTQGVKRYGNIPTPYDRDEETLKILAARVHRADGRVDEARVSPGSLVSLPNPRVGDVVEVRYRVDEVKRSFFGDHEEQIFLFGDTIPMVLSEFVLMVPEGYRITHHISNAEEAAAKPQIARSEQGMTIYRWRYENTPPVNAEPDMPSLTEIVPTLYVSHFADWSEFGKWYWGLIREQHTASPTLKKKVRELTDDKATIEEKIRALYHFVTNDIEYVAWEFGVHGFKPYDASTILERKFGDCKDKATLLKVMLAEIGVESYQALVRAARPYIRQDMTLPLFRHFNHAICYVPAGRGYPEMWLDGTAQYYPFAQVPPSDCIRQSCVVMEAEGGRLMRIPPPPMEKNMVVADVEIHFTEGGSEGLITHVEVKSKVQGQAEAAIRYWFHNPGQRKERLEEILSRRYAVAHLNWEKFPDLADMYVPCEFSYSADLERYVRKDDQGYVAPLFQSFPRASSFREAVPLEKRDTDLVLTFYYPYKVRLKYKCLPRYRFTSLPKSTTAKTEDCAFSLDVKKEGEDVVVEENILIAKDRVKPAEYAGFRRFLLEIDQAELQDVVLTPAE